MDSLSAPGISKRRKATVRRTVSQPGTVVRADRNIVPRVTLLAPLSIADLDRSLVELRAELASGATDGPREQRARLRELHQLLMRATALSARPPTASLALAAEVLRGADAATADDSGPRPRTVFRLLRAGLAEAAWAVLTDNATGVVEDPVRASTSSGAVRTAWRLPLLTRIEPPIVFADLPGFRDPRYGAPDHCYDITDRVRLRHHVDEILLDGGAVTFGGWAALDALVTDQDEQVRLIAASGDVDVVISGTRLRRPDLVNPTGVARNRRAWAGWSVPLEPDDPRLVAGEWALSLELEHAGVCRRVGIGDEVSGLARAATRVSARLGARQLRWDARQRPWRLVLLE